MLELSQIIDGNIELVTSFCEKLGVKKGSVIEDIFSMAWGNKTMPLELTSALDLHFSMGVVLWHFVEINVMGELIKRFIYNEKFGRICQILKRRFLKALSFFSGIYNKEDKMSVMALLSRHLKKPMPE